MTEPMIIAAIGVLLIAAGGLRWAYMRMVRCAEQLLQALEDTE